MILPRHLAVCCLLYGSEVPAAEEWVMAKQYGWALAGMIALGALAAVPIAFAQGAPAPQKKANIAVSGCLMRQGYATFMVADAHVDGIGDAAASAAPGTDKPATPTPPRFVLDNAASVGSHVGEKVQVLGFSDWVNERDTAPPPALEPNGPPAPMPHIDLQTLKMIASSCS